MLLAALQLLAFDLDPHLPLALWYLFHRLLPKCFVGYAGKRKLVKETTLCFLATRIILPMSLQVHVRNGYGLCHNAKIFFSWSKKQCNSANRINQKWDREQQTQQGCFIRYALKAWPHKSLAGLEHATSHIPYPALAATLTNAMQRILKKWGGRGPSSGL